MSAEKNISDLVDAARRLIDSGEFEKAKIILERVIKSVPQDVSALILLADIYKKKGDLHTAESILKGACRLERKNDELHFRLALVYKEIGGVYKGWKAKRLFKVCTRSSDYSIRSAAGYHIRKLRIGKQPPHLANQVANKGSSQEGKQSNLVCPNCGAEYYHEFADLVEEAGIEKFVFITSEDRQFAFGKCQFCGAGLQPAREPWKRIKWTDLTKGG